MKRAVFIIAFALALAPQIASAAWLKSLADAQKQAKAKNRLIFVDMFANWCGWCHRMEREVFPTEVFQKATDDMVLLRLDTEDRGEGTRISQKFGITSLPTILILTHDLVIAGKIPGYAPANAYAEMVAKIEKDYGEFRKRLSQEKALDPQKRLDLARELTERHAFKESEALFRKLIADKKAPDSVRDAAWYELAVALFFQQRYGDALVTIEQFSKQRKDGEAYERSRILAGQIYMTQGNFAAAHAEMKKFKETFPNSPLVKTAETLIPALEARMRQ